MWPLVCVGIACYLLGRRNRASRNQVLAVRALPAATARAPYRSFRWSPEYRRPRSPAALQHTLNGVRL